MKNTLFGFALAIVSLSAIAGCSSNSGSDDASSSDEASRAAKCKAASDCTGVLPRNEETCSDGSSSGASWSCESSKCKITYCSKDDSTGDSSSCSSKSDCTGALPRNEVQCADGSSDGASWSCSKGACAISYCAEAGGTASTSTSASNSCDSADDCSGALPRNEIPCADGSYSGAEWSCKSHKCAISYCSDNGGTAN